MRILITGAAGLIGGEVAARLVARGHAVTALVRRATAVRANDGTPVRVAKLAGDVTLPGLGIGPGGAPRFDLIVHGAAATAFDAPPEVHAAVNIEGTRHVLAFAAATPVLHLSTAYVAGDRDGPVFEHERDAGQRFANGYEASKAAAEALVAAHAGPWAIARPSIVVGDWADGRLRRFDGLYLLLRLIAQGRLRTLPAAPDARLDFVPIDHVCAGIAALAEALPGATGATIHLVSGGRPVTPPMLAAAIAGAGLPPPRFVPPDAFDPAGLPAAERRWHGAAAALYTRYLQRRPAFDDRRARALTGRACPPLDAAWVERLVRFAVTARFRPA